MPSTKPDVIFFDLDETLVENQLSIEELFARLYVDFKMSLGEEGNSVVFFDALRERASLLWGSMFETQIPPEQQFIECFEHCIDAVDNVARNHRRKLAQSMFEHFQELGANNVVLQDGAEAALGKLSERGIVTGIITNGIEAIQLAKIHKLDLHNRVDHVTVSAQARAHKPLPAVFSLAMERAQVQPEKAWQIGDHPTNDVAGAIRAGMCGIYYNPNKEKSESVFSELSEKPMHVINHHSEILALIN